MGSEMCIRDSSTEASMASTEVFIASTEVSIAPTEASIASTEPYADAHESCFHGSFDASMEVSTEAYVEAG